MQALAFSLTCAAIVAKCNKARTFHSLWFSSIFNCYKLYENKSISQSTQNNMLQCKVNPPEGGFSWFLLHDLKQSGQQTSFPITNETPRACEEITAWVERLANTVPCRTLNPVSSPELLMIKIPVLNVQYKYSLTFITSSTSGRVLTCLWKTSAIPSMWLPNKS